jgi:hypothetical protein
MPEMPTISTISTIAPRIILNFNAIEPPLNDSFKEISLVGH